MPLYISNILGFWNSTEIISIYHEQNDGLCDTFYYIYPSVDRYSINIIHIPTFLTTNMSSTLLLASFCKYYLSSLYLDASNVKSYRISKVKQVQK